MKHFLFLIPAALLSAFSLQAQDMPCGTEHAMQRARSENPGTRQVTEQLEEFTRNWLLRNMQQDLSDTVLYIIPVVVHIIHNYGSENFPDAQVHDAVRILNEDFQKRNKDTVSVKSDFQPIIGDVKVEFRLARIDPSGNCTNGITRTVSTITYNADSDSQLKSLISWNTAKYMNIWVVNVIPDAGGYAYYPGTAPQPWREGIVIRNTQFGGILTSGGSNFAARSLTHEAGHYFNLRHTWGSGTVGDAGNCSTDDLVGDTPNTIGTSQSCDLSQVTCSTLDNVNNYMDYTACGRMFTQGQQSRMDGAINAPAGSRNNLWTQSNLLATGVNDGYVPQLCRPVADFRPGIVFLCQGDSIQFLNKSWNADSMATDWTLPGGVPAATSVENPYVRYDTAGIYDVKLKAYTSGGADSITTTAAVHVSGDSADHVSPFLESFESTTLPGGEWLTYNNGGGTNTWNLTSAAAFTGSKSVMVDNYSLGKTEDVMVLISPTFDLTTVTTPKLTFRVAYAQRTATDADKLKVFVSTNCGKTWLQRYNKSSTQIQSTAGPVATYFTPASSEWLEETVSLAFAQTAKQIRIKFEFVSDRGNNIYLDDINIDGVSSAETATQPDIRFNVYPNPASSAAEVTFVLPAPGAVRLVVTDLLGRPVGKPQHHGELAPGAYRYSIGGGITAPGIYVVRLETESGIYVRRLLFTGR